MLDLCLYAHVHMCLCEKAIPQTQPQDDIILSARFDRHTKTCRSHKCDAGIQVVRRI